MGKSKQVPRSKGNYQSSSSAKAAELVTKAGGTLPGQFFILSKYLKSQGDETDTFVPTDSEFCYVFKKLSKKDVNTKKKGLQEFGQLCLEKDVHDISAIVPYWIPHYTKLSLDNDRCVREMCQDCFYKLAGRIKNKLAPHLKDIMGMWLLAQCDAHMQCAHQARKTFETLFKESKQSEAVWFCRMEIIRLLMNTMFETTAESIKRFDVCEADEVEARLARLQTSSLDALSRFIKLTNLQFRTQVKESLESFLTNKIFWKFHKQPSPNVRRAFYDLMTSLCDDGLIVGDSIHIEQVSRSVLLSLDESNPHVIPALWKAVVSVCNVKECWSFVNVKKAFLPKLHSILNAGGHGCAEVIYPNIVVVLDKFPQEIKDEEGFYFRFLGRIRNGLNQSSVMLSTRESDAIAKSFVKCCKFIIHSFIENQPPNQFDASIVIKDHILALIKSALTTENHLLTCYLPYASEIIWYLHKMSTRINPDDDDKRLQAFNHVFKTAVDELVGVCECLIMGETKTGEESLAKLNLFFQSFLSFNKSFQKSSSNTKKIVRFKETKMFANDDQVCKTRSSEEIKKAYMSSDVFKGFVDKLSLCLFSSIKLNGKCPNRMQLFRMFFECFACDEFLGSLKPSGEGRSTTDGSSIHCFLKEVVCSWMTSVDLTLFAEVTNIFLAALCLESDDERTRDFDLALTKLEICGKSSNKSKLLKYLSLLFGSSNVHLMELWMSSVKCNEFLIRSVADCVNDFTKHVPHEEAWNVLSIVLARNEVEISRAKFQILSSIKEHLHDSIYGSDSNRSFDFIQILFSLLLESKSIPSLVACDSFQWFLDMLLWASLNVGSGLSNDICSSSMRTLISTLETLISCSRGIENKFENSTISHKIKGLLLNCISNLIFDYNQLKDALKTTDEILRLFYEQFDDFNFFSCFVDVPVQKLFDTDRSKSSIIPSDQLITRFSEFKDHSGKTSSNLESHIFMQVFYAKLFNSLTSSPSDSKDEKVMKDFDGSNLELDFNSIKVESHLTMNEKIKSDLLAMRNDDNDGSSFNSYINNLMDCMAYLTYHCSELACSEKMMKDLTISWNIVIPLLGEKMATSLVVNRIESCLENQNDDELNMNSLIFYNLLQKFKSVNMICDKISGRILKRCEVDKNLKNIAMACVCLFPDKTKLFEKFVDFIKESLNEDDLNDSLLNSFDVVNAILSADGSCLINSSHESNDNHELHSTSKSKNYSEMLFSKINRVKQFCEGLFEGGIFDEQVAKRNSVVMNFYKNVLSTFVNSESSVEKHWDEILCFTVSRFEGLDNCCDNKDFKLSPMFDEVLESLLSLVLQMCKLFNSKEFADTSPRLADEWMNVFRGTLFVYLNSFFVNVLINGADKIFQHLNVLELLCEVISHSPPESLQHFVPPILRPSSSSSNDEEVESFFELLVSFMESPHRCVQVSVHSILKKLLLFKTEWLRNKILMDAIDDQSQSEESEGNSKYIINKVMFLSSLINSSDVQTTKLNKYFLTSSKISDEFPWTSTNYSEILTHLLISETILDAFKSSPALVKRSLTEWFSEGVDGRMLILSTAMLTKPFELLQPIAHGDFRPKVSISGDETPASNKIFYSCLDCENFYGGLVIKRKKLQDRDVFTRDEFKSFNQDLEEQLFRVFVKTLHTFPRIVRNWFSGLDLKSAAQVDKFVTKYVSPALISKELNKVHQTSTNKSDLNFQVKIHSKELIASFSVDDATVTLNAIFPDNYPLNSLKISLDHNRITSVKQFSSTWLLQLNKLLNYKDGTLIEALMFMSKNLDRHFDGNSCMICFSSILSHQGAKVLPKLKCNTCKKRFHSVCLFTWFKSSHNANCPLCRSTF